MDDENIREPMDIDGFPDASNGSNWKSAREQLQHWQMNRRKLVQKNIACLLIYYRSFCLYLYCYSKSVDEVMHDLNYTSVSFLNPKFNFLNDEILIFTFHSGSSMIMYLAEDGKDKTF